MKDWTEITVAVPAKDTDTAAAIAQMAAPAGIYIEDYADMEEQVAEITHSTAAETQELIDASLLSADKNSARIHLYLSAGDNPQEAGAYLTQRLEAANIPYTLTFGEVNEEDWATAWKKYYHPVRVGRRILICPSWEACDAQPDDVVIQLDPGMAFGTGTHETTRLCLSLLEDYLQPGARMLDVGTGSGILAVSGILLGASQADGIDIDETSVRVAKENAQRNGTSEHCHFICGDLTASLEPDGQYDLLSANIVADIILRLTPDAGGFLAPGGIYLVSGIIDTREAEVCAALSANGYDIVEIRREKGWCAIASRKR